ncbi:MAG: hypothetical protein EWV53_03795, partial [Microcystis panniformis Mp_MB_F_20051200_S9]
EVFSGFLGSLTVSSFDISLFYSILLPVSSVLFCKTDLLPKLLNIKDKVHVLSKINFNSPQKMTLEAFTMPKK